MTSKIPKIKIGADPELFVKDERSGNFISGHTFVTGTKYAPDVWKGGAVQADGVALEFNIPPASNANQFSQSILDNVHYLQGILTGYDEKLKIKAVPTAFFDVDYFNDLPEEVKALGCQPDYNAYTLQANPKPDSNVFFRTGSGHVHVGFINGDNQISDPLSDEHMQLCAKIVKQLDIALFIPSLLFDNDNKRRALYGSPGAFRPKPYGLEYRVLSNRWLRNATLSSWVFTETLRATRDVFKGKIYSEIIDFNDAKNIFANLDKRKITKNVRDFAEAYPSIVHLPKGFRYA